MQAEVINVILCFFQEFLFYEACNATRVVLCHIITDFNFVEGGLGGFYSKKELLDGLLDVTFVIDQGSALDSSEVINSDD